MKLDEQEFKLQKMILTTSRRTFFTQHAKNSIALKIDKYGQILVLISFVILFLFYYTKNIPENIYFILLPCLFLFYNLFTFIRIGFIYECAKHHFFRTFECYSQLIGLFVLLPIIILEMGLALKWLSLPFNPFILHVAMCLIMLYLSRLKSNIDRDFIPIDKWIEQSIHHKNNQ